MLHLRLSTKEIRCYVSCAEAIKKKIQPQNVCYSYRILTKLANNPPLSVQRELANSKNLFPLTICIFLKDIQLNRTECLQNDLSLNLKDVGHPFSSSGAGRGKLVFILPALSSSQQLCII